MIDIVNTSSVNGTSARPQPQAEASVSASAPAASSSKNAEAFSYYSQIRVDNLQNAVILEYRSSKTGEVVLQYPTQRQIEAFRDAERILEQSTTTSSAPPAPAPTESAPPAPQVEASVSAPPPAGGGGEGATSTQSVVV